MAHQDFESICCHCRFWSRSGYSEGWCKLHDEMRASLDGCPHFTKTYRLIKMDEEKESVAILCLIALVVAAIVMLLFFIL